MVAMQSQRAYAERIDSAVQQPSLGVNPAATLRFLSSIDPETETPER
jgi:hypothetical protein